MFDETELVDRYYQANEKDKRKVIQSIMDDTGLLYEEVIDMLRQNGVDSRKLPRARRGSKNAVDPDSINGEDDDDPVFDAVIEMLDAEVEKTKAEQAAKQEYDPLKVTLDYIRNLFARKKQLEAELAKIKAIIEQIVEASK